jgi:hypothetical protein
MSAVRLSEGRSIISREEVQRLGELVNGDPNAVPRALPVLLEGLHHAEVDPETLADVIDALGNCWTEEASLALQAFADPSVLAGEARGRAERV